MTAKRSNGANGAPETISSVVSMLQGPAASGLLVSQRLAFEAARFWARRMRAYADQFELLATCTDPQQFAKANAHFLEQLQQDYVSESAVVTEMLTPHRDGDADQDERAA